jgi:hypothetical protein
MGAAAEDRRQTVDFGQPAPVEPAPVRQPRQEAPEATARAQDFYYHVSN